MESGPVRARAGRQPYDRLNGMRVGALAGGVLGALAAALTRMPWLIAGGAVVGSGVGFWYERRSPGGAPDERPHDRRDGG